MLIKPFYVKIIFTLIKIITQYQSWHWNKYYWNIWVHYWIILYKYIWKCVWKPWIIYVTDYYVLIVH